MGAVGRKHNGEIEHAERKTKEAEQERVHPSEQPAGHDERRGEQEHEQAHDRRRHQESIEMRRRDPGKQGARIVQQTAVVSEEPDLVDDERRRLGPGRGNQ